MDFLLFFYKIFKRADKTVYKTWLSDICFFVWVLLYLLRDIRKIPLLKSSSILLKWNIFPFWFPQKNRFKWTNRRWNDTKIRLNYSTKTQNGSSRPLEVSCKVRFSITTTISSKSHYRCLENINNNNVSLTPHKNSPFETDLSSYLTSPHLQNHSTPWWSKV